MLDEEKIKSDLKALIEKFKLERKFYLEHAEANTETRLIESLFEILGWTKDDFIKQDKAQRGERKGRPDYSLRINDRKVVFVEVKKVGIKLEKEADSQVISYSLSKEIPFAISTNFEQLNVFCVEERDKKKRMILTFLTPDDYLNDFHNLMLLSKKSFEQNLLLEKAQALGLLKKRISINEPLLADLMHIRRTISDNIEEKYPNNYSANEKDDIVQRILDRLIFIRKCEDSGINPYDKKLKDLIGASEHSAYSKLKELFTIYDDKYNSGLFKPAKDNDCDKINLDGKIIQKLISYLYDSKDKEFKYNFYDINADILGQVYEQYLGKILAQTKLGKAKLKEGQAHRKEQGIYYTPTYIVDYIVKNTLGELLKNKKINAETIKILDPACGSGSFLIKAFDYLNEHLSEDDEAKQHRLDSQGAYSVKTEILKNNIFGVDLDNKAVEITKLNLLLKAAENCRRLPEEVDMHVRYGNSLIDDETIIGLSAFKWEGDFQEGTFDVVVGNPPWSAKISSNLNSAIAKRYELSEKNINLCAAFIMAGLNKLSPKGYFAFLLPKVIIKNEAYSKVRERILREYSLIEIDDFGVFPGVASDAVCVIVRNKKSKQNIKIKFFNKEILLKENDIEQEIFFKTGIFSLESNVHINEIINKISTSQKSLKDLFQIKRGIELGQKANLVECKKCGTYNESNIKYYGSADKVCKKCGHKLQLNENVIQISSLERSGKYNLLCVAGTQIKRYSINKNYFIIPGLAGIDYKKDAFNRKKILIKRIATAIEGTYSKEDLLAFNTLYSIYSDTASEDELKYVLSILNSTLIRFYYEFSYNVGMSLTTQVTIECLSKIPIKMITSEKQQPIIKLVDYMLSLNKQLQGIGDKKTSQTAKLEEEIKKTDEEINDLVYKLYGITDEEKKIIEDSLK